MLRRRLYLQIYFTIIASLVIVVVSSGLLWSFFGRDYINHEVFDITGRLAYLSLPVADAPDSVQQKAVERLGGELGIDISLFDRHRRRSPRLESQLRRLLEWRQAAADAGCMGARPARRAPSIAESCDLSRHRGPRRGTLRLSAGAAADPPA